MAFRGDIDQIPLSNIVQALMMNGQEGILTLEGDEFAARLFILSVGIRPLNTQAKSPDLLRRVLLKQKVLTDQQFTNAFSTWVPGSSYPGEFLISRRIIEGSVVETELRKQLEDFLFEIFLIPKLKYEFLAGEDPTDYELFNPDQLGEVLIFNANSILMEAVRREDEWGRLKQVIPSDTEIYVATETAAQAFNDPALSRELVSAVAPYLRGEHSVHSIVDNSTISRFEIYELLAKLLTSGAIRPLQLEEKQELAERLRKSLRPKDAVGIYRSILLNDPGNTAVRQKLIQLLGKAKGPASEIADHHLYLARQNEEVDTEKALDHLDEVLERCPEHIEALWSLFAIQTNQDRYREAIAAAKRLTAAAVKAENSGILVELARQVVEIYPEEVGILNDLAEALAAAGEDDDAAACFVAAAAVYEERRDHTRLRKTCERLAKICPAEAQRLKRAVEVERRAKTSRKIRVKVVAIMLFIGVLLGFGSLWGIHEHQSRTTLADVKSTVHRLAELADFDQAREALEDFTQRFRFSTTQSEAHALLRELDQREADARERQKKLASEQRFKTRAEYTRAQIAFKNDKYVESIGILRSLDFDHLSEKTRGEAVALEKRIKSYLGKAAKYERAAQTAFDEGDFAKCHQLRKALLYHYPNAVESKTVQLPIYIETTPPDADIIVDGRRVGRTPHAILLNPRDSAPDIVLRRDGYKPIELERSTVDGRPFDPLSTPRLALELVKDTYWSFPVGGSIETPITARDGRGYFGTRNGYVYCVDLNERKEVWSYHVAYSMDVTGEITLWKNFVLFGTQSGSFYVLSAVTGREVAEISTTKDMLPIRGGPSQVTSDGITFLNGGGRSITAIDIAAGKKLWTKTYRARPLLGKPLVRRDRIHVLTGSGGILAISATTGNVESFVAPRRGSVRFPGTVRGDKIYFISDDRVLGCADLESARLLWEIEELNAPVAAAPTADSDSVVVATTDRKLHCFSHSGERRWSIELSDPVAASGIIFKNQFIVGTTNGRVLAYDCGSGSRLWQYSTKDKVRFLAPGEVHKGRFCIGSVNNALFVTALD